MNKKGFTLFEFILYFSLSSLLIYLATTSFIQFGIIVENIKLKINDIYELL